MQTRAGNHPDPERPHWYLESVPFRRSTSRVIRCVTIGRSRALRAPKGNRFGTRFWPVGSLSYVDDLRQRPLQFGEELAGGGGALLCLGRQDTLEEFLRAVRGARQVGG